MAPHSSVLACRIPWTEESGGLQSTGSQRVRHDRNDLAWIILGAITGRSRAGIWIWRVWFKGEAFCKMYSHFPGSTWQEPCVIQMQRSQFFDIETEAKTLYWVGEDPLCLPLPNVWIHHLSEPPTRRAAILSSMLDQCSLNVWSPQELTK